MKNKLNLSQKLYVDKNGKQYAYADDIKKFIKIYKKSLDVNASEKRKIIEVGKAKALLRFLAGEELSR